MILSPKYWTEPVTKSNYMWWRAYLKKQLLLKRGYYSNFSGKKITESTGCHMHEGIVTRACVPRSISWFGLIFDERNSIILLPEEHIPLPPSREWCTTYLYKMYGRDTIRQWFYEELPWKVLPFELP